MSATASKRAGPARRPRRDLTLRCVDCSSDFVWTEGEQVDYALRGFEQPKRCRRCRARRRAERSGAAHPRSETTGVHHDTHCAQCSAPVTVPFRPRRGRPVYCRSCFDG